MINQQILENKIRKIYKKILSEQLNPAAIEDLTDRNDHTGAVLELAKQLNQKDFIKVLEAIEIIHEFEGSMPDEIHTYRKGLKNRLMQLLKSKYSNEEYEAIRLAF
jgi:hypothetical protein